MGLINMFFPVAPFTKGTIHLLGHFFIPFVLSLVCAHMVIYSQNPLSSILSFIGTILNAAILLFSLEIEFLTFILMLVYIGAIAVLFLFVVMMLELSQGKFGPKKVTFLGSKSIVFIFYTFIFIKVNQLF